MELEKGLTEKGTKAAVWCSSLGIASLVISKEGYDNEIMDAREYPIFQGADNCITTSSSNYFEHNFGDHYEHHLGSSHFVLNGLILLVMGAYLIGRKTGINNFIKDNIQRISSKINNLSSVLYNH